MGLHYGIWEAGTPNLSAAIINTNRRLAELAPPTSDDRVLDAGCGVGGSAIFLSSTYGCTVTGITLSDRQVAAANGFAAERGVSDRVRFAQQDYTSTDFADNTFDLVWAVESMQTATNKHDFFREMSRVLRPGGTLLIADVFKMGNWAITDTPVMQTMLNGWAMSDILSVDHLEKQAASTGFTKPKFVDVTAEVRRSVRRYYWFSLAGMIGTKWYNLFHDGTYFGRVHYKTGFAQAKGYRQGLWGYGLFRWEKGGS